MSIKKADTNTFLNKQSEFFSDFLDSFAFSPFGNDLGKLSNARSVVQSIKNLVYTIVGERLYLPKVGCNIYNTNFEFNDNTTDASINLYIETTIKYYEPRCNLISTKVDSNTDAHTITITIVFSIINNPEQITMTIPLKRVR